MDPGHSSRLRAVETRLLVLSGEDGTNGKIGNLRKDVDGHSTLIKAIGLAALSGVVGSALAIYQAGQKSGAREQEYQFFRAEVGSLRSEVRDMRATLPVLLTPRRPAPQGDEP